MIITILGIMWNFNFLNSKSRIKMSINPIIAFKISGKSTELIPISLKIIKRAVHSGDEVKKANSPGLIPKIPVEAKFLARVRWI